ncbi:MAG TPA: hypothetical protein PLE45_10220 [Spirochaetota bacterium]|nr:hypothetical protein [Spirochaetota bacterium]HOL56576.1 hypothetical protein [Spirochaetota bacterium]HPP04977.1 hypothetical protein [Spirochaetota bacterium]
MKKIYIFLFVLIITSCSGFFTSNEINIKYREKNIVEIIRIDSVNGNIDIIGWPKDFIEINTKKKIQSGFSGDLNLMDTIFKFDPEIKELLIKTKIPSRINGSIELKIYIPFTLLKIFIDSKKGNIFINDYLGDVELTNSNGNVDMVFQGTILRINSINSRLNLVVKSYNSSDIIINSENGDNKIFFEAIGKMSYFDLLSLNTSNNIYLAYEIDHNISIRAKEEDISIKYNLENKNLIKTGYSFLSGSFGQNPEFFNIDIHSENGKINVLQLKK